MFFEKINPELWGNVSIAMLTLFRVMTFEDWTDVMYETMVIYSYAWVFFISFIFLTAFAFLNMVIGIVVNVLEEEHQKVMAEDPENIQLKDVYDELRNLRMLIEENKRNDFT